MKAGLGFYNPSGWRGRGRVLSYNRAGNIAYPRLLFHLACNAPEHIIQHLRYGFSALANGGPIDFILQALTRNSHVQIKHRSIFTPRLSLKFNIHAVNPTTTQDPTPQITSLQRSRHYNFFLACQENHHWIAAGMGAKKF